MELIFFYINQAISKFIDKKGFNFSPNYHFYLEYIDEKYVLKQKKHKQILPPDFFDKEGCITNITAIVGENGSGKTTLLNTLLNYSGNVTIKNNDLAYNRFYEEKYEEDKTLAIYMHESHLICYHNIENFINETEIEASYLYQGSNELKDIVKENRAFENISKIFITNSAYSTKNGVLSHGSINEISLNINSLNTLKNIFFKKICQKSPYCVGGWYEIQNIVYNEKNIDDFQYVLDILYLKHVLDNNIQTPFTKNIVRPLKIRFKLLTTYVSNQYKEISQTLKTDKSPDNYIKTLFEDILASFDHELLKTDIFVVIYINLLYELLVFCEKTTFADAVHLSTRKDLVEFIRTLLDESSKKHGENSFPFLDCFDEIQEYERVLCDCEMSPCYLPLSDMAYSSYKEIKHGSQAYINFLSLIKKSVYERKHSFVIKYIDIADFQLASGERALLNFFSWINLIPYFKCISNDVSESLHDNVLLLIDEIDLYCHPLWQQKMLYNLIEEIKAEYNDKRVQIIFTTHSPIVLSDMPRNNIIYLKRENDKCCIDDNARHEETFGANIYRLFNHAFFLERKGQIGQFAKTKIEYIINKIKPTKNDEYAFSYPSLSDDEFMLLEQHIELIGEKIIRDKLLEMLYKCKYSSMGPLDRQIKLYEEQIKRLKSRKEND